MFPNFYVFQLKYKVICTEITESNYLCRFRKMKTKIHGA